MNPLDLPGLEFLAFFIVTSGVAVVGAAVLRWALRQPADGPDTRPAMSVYDIAYLCGGKRQAVHAAITRLVHDQCLALDPLTKTITVTARLPGDALPLEKAVYREAAEQGQPKLFQAAGCECDAIQNQLEEKGFLVSAKQSLIVRFLPFLLIDSVIVLGLFKFLIGVARGKPIGFLVVLLVLLVLTAGLFLLRRPFRTRRGDRLLAMLKQDHANLDGDARERPSELPGSQLALALGLFGAGILTHQSQLGLRQTIAPPSQGGWAGGDGGGCGGGSCGGGGGCGGGGCGGGCGGCGGG